MFRLMWGGLHSNLETQVAHILQLGCLWRETNGFNVYIEKAAIFSASCNVIKSVADQKTILMRESCCFMFY